MSVGVVLSLKTNARPVKCAVSNLCVRVCVDIVVSLKINARSLKSDLT